MQISTQAVPWHVFTMTQLCNWFIVHHSESMFSQTYVTLVFWKMWGRSWIL